MTDTQAMHDPALTQPVPPVPHIALRGLVALLSVVTFVWAVAGALGAMTMLSKPIWGLFGFEVVTVVSCVFGVLLGLGRFRAGWALGLLCVAGAILTDGVFGWYVDARSVVSAAIGSGDAPAWASDFVRYTMLERAGSACLLGAVAAVAVLVRTRAAMTHAAIAGVFGLPVVAALVWLGMFGGVAAISTPTTGIVEVIRIVGVLVGGLVLLVLASIAGHYAIRAFELGRPAGELPDPGMPTKTVTSSSGATAS